MRFPKRIETAWKAARAATGSEAAETALDLTRPRQAVVAMRLPAAALPEQVLAGAEIFVTGRLDVAGFRVPGLITEYLPPAAGFPERHSRDEIDVYLARRLSALAVKWNLTRLVAVDPEAVALMRDWLAREPQPGREIVETVAPEALARQTAPQVETVKAG